jgi:hypothetical protein
MKRGREDDRTRFVAAQVRAKEPARWMPTRAQKASSANSIIRTADQTISSHKA